MNPPANLRPPGMENVGIEQRLHEQIPPDLTFRDEPEKACAWEITSGTIP